jgi:hypothetical protein
VPLNTTLTGRSHSKKTQPGRAKKRLTVTLLQHLTVFAPSTIPRIGSSCIMSWPNISPWRHPAKQQRGPGDRHIDTRERDHLRARHDRMVAPTGLACSRNASRMSERDLIQAKIDTCERMKGCLIQSAWRFIGQGGTARGHRDVESQDGVSLPYYTRWRGE